VVQIVMQSNLSKIKLFIFNVVIVCFLFVSGKYLLLQYRFFFGDKFVRLKPKNSVHSLFVQLSTSNHI